MKKGTRICAAGLLALTMALGAAPALGVLSPATALAETTVTADGVTVTVEKDQFAVVTTNADGSHTTKEYDKGELTNVLQRTDLAGATIVLGEGEFTANAALNNVFTIQGAGVGKTVLKGTLTANWGTYDFDAASDADDTFVVSGLTMQADAAGQTAFGGIQSNGFKVDFSNCELKGFYKVAEVFDGNDNTTVNLDNVKLNNVYIAVAIADGSKAQIGDFNLTGDSTYFYAVQAYNGGYARNAVYSTVEAWQNDKADSDTWNNINTDGKLDIYWVAKGSDAGWTEDNGYVCVATNGSYKYTMLRRAINAATPHETVSVQADCDLLDTATVESSYVTLEGNGHVVTTKGNGQIAVDATDFTVQNITVDGIKADGEALFKLKGTGTAPIDVYYDNVTLDNRGGKYAIDAENADVTISGQFDITTGVGAEAGIIVKNTGTYQLASVTFAADAKVSHNDQSGKSVPLVRAYSFNDNGMLPVVTVADPAALVVTTTDVDVDKDGKVDYQNVEVTSQEVAQDVAMTRLYNPYTGEHFYTGDANEAQVLVTMGWNDEGQAWVAPAESETPVYRLYNPYTDEHHYTTDENEYSELAKIGWKQEGVKFYSADESGTAVYRLFNPYATRYTHIYTTDGNEAAELQEQGWSYEGVGFYGVK